MNKSLFRTLSTLMLITVLLGACSGQDNTALTENRPLRVSWSLWPGYYPMAIAIEKDLFVKHGVKVEPVFYAAYIQQLPDLAANMVDGSLLTLSDTMFDAISTKTKVVMVVDNSAGADQIVASRNITSLKDLRGKRIGVSQATVSGLLLVYEMLEKNGISPTDVTFVEIPPEGVPAAIPSLIDAGYTYDPFTSEALTKGNKVIYSSADSPGLIADVLAIRHEIARDQPADVRAFVAAWQEAVDFWKRNPEEGNAIIAATIGLTPAEVTPVGVDIFDQHANEMTFIPGATPISIYHTAENELRFLTQIGSITKPIKIEDLLDPSFLK